MTLSDFKEFERKQGKHWFSERTMQFFDSSVYRWDNETGLFISKEKTGFDSTDYRYTVRRADFKTGEVHNLSEFQEYATLYRAEVAMTGVFLPAVWAGLRTLDRSRGETSGG